MGRAAIWEDQLEECYYQKALHRLRPLRGFDSRLMLAFLHLWSTNGHLQNYVTQTSIAHLTREKLAVVPLPVPNREEQRAIAKVLDDVNGLLFALTQFIAKKRDLKQAAMQQLLTGRRRLPGFSRDWATTPLGEILRVRHGRSQHQIARPDGKYPILASGGEIGRTDRYLYDQPSVLIGRKGTIDAPQFVDVPFWTIDTLFFTEIGPCAWPRFVYYLFQTIDWRRYNEASGVPSLNAATIESINVRVPTGAEQAAIAVVLSDMDVEIAALEQRLAKTRALKQDPGAADGSGSFSAAGGRLAGGMVQACQ